MKIYLQGLTCANCAGKIEDTVLGLKEIQGVEINLLNQSMEVTLIDEAQEKNIFPVIEKIVHKFEPDVKVAKKQEAVKKSHNNECCGHNHGEGHHHSHDKKNNGVGRKK